MIQSFSNVKNILHIWTVYIYYFIIDKIYSHWILRFSVNWAFLAHAQNPNRTIFCTQQIYSQNQPDLGMRTHTIFAREIYPEIYPQHQPRHFFAAH